MPDAPESLASATVQPVRRGVEAVTVLVGRLHGRGVGGAEAPQPCADQWSGTTATVTRLEVADTDGDGVSVRDACDDARRSSAPGDGIPEGTAVLLIARGAGPCIEWMLVQAPDGRESWVRLRYLAPPLQEASATRTPAATARPTPSPSPTATQTPAVTPRPTAAPADTQTPSATPEPTPSPTATRTPAVTPRPTPSPTATRTPTATPAPTAVRSPEAFHCHCRRVINDRTRCDQRYTAQGGPGYCHTGETHGSFNTWPPRH